MPKNKAPKAKGANSVGALGMDLITTAPDPTTNVKDATVDAKAKTKQMTFRRASGVKEDGGGDPSWGRLVVWLLVGSVPPSTSTIGSWCSSVVVVMMGVFFFMSNTCVMSGSCPALTSPLPPRAVSRLPYKKFISREGTSIEFNIAHQRISNPAHACLP